MRVDYRMWFWLLPVAVAASVAVSGSVAAQPSPRTFVELRDLKIGIERAIQDAKRVSSEPPFFIIRKVELKLKGERKLNGDGTVSFNIPIFGYGVDLSARGTSITLQKLEVDLVPAENQVVGGDSLVDLTELTRVLKSSFREDSKTTGTLAATAVKYTNSWTLQLSADGKINVVVAKAGASIADEKSQEITFHLCQTRNRSDCVQ